MTYRILESGGRVASGSGHDRAGVDRAVPGAIAQGGQVIRESIAHQPLHCGEGFRVAPPPRQDGDLMAASHGRIYQMPPQKGCSAQDQNSHSR